VVPVVRIVLDGDLNGLNFSNSSIAEKEVMTKKIQIYYRAPSNVPVESDGAARFVEKHGPCGGNGITRRAAQAPWR